MVCCIHRINGLTVGFLIHSPAGLPPYIAGCGITLDTAASFLTVRGHLRDVARALRYFARAANQPPRTLMEGAWKLVSVHIEPYGYSAHYQEAIP